MKCSALKSIQVPKQSILLQENIHTHFKRLQIVYKVPASLFLTTVHWVIELISFISSHFNKCVCMYLGKNPTEQDEGGD